MAVAFDSVGPSATGVTSTTATGAVLTWTHTAVASGVSIVADFAYGYGTGSTPGTVSATCDGVAMTQLGFIDNNNQTGTASAGRSYKFGIANRASGAHTIVITVTGGSSTSRTNIGGSEAYSGADLTSPFGTAATAAGSGTAVAVTVPSTTAGNMVTATASTGAPTLTNPATSRWINNFDTINAACNAGGADKAAGGSVTFTWSATQSDLWAAVGLEVKVPSGAPAGRAQSRRRPAYFRGTKRRLSATYGR